MSEIVRLPGVVARGRSLNKKLSPVVYTREEGMKRGRPAAESPFVSSTYTSIRATCSSECPYLGNGCFASSGFSKIIMRLLDDGAAGLPALEVIRNEVKAIERLFQGRLIPQDGAKGGRDLRLHVGGDTSCELGTRLLARAAEGWKKRMGGSVWTYTHHWRTIPHEAWGPISVLASVECQEDIPHALDLGYAVAMTVDHFKQKKAYRFTDDEKLIPCPAETHGTTCAECRLCIDRDVKKMGAVIGFALHGHISEKRKAMAALEAVQKKRLPLLNAS